MRHTVWESLAEIEASLSMALIFCGHLEEAVPPPRGWRALRDAVEGAYKAHKETVRLMRDKE